MAAGMGSGFGGLKQITPIDDDNNFLIDYSIYDAIQTGFNKVVFIIKEENYEDFKETIGKRLENKIDVSYVYQKIDDLPNSIQIPENRTKPWGTVHAILATKNIIDGPFAIINADDFYGYDSYKIVAEFLRNNQNSKEQISIPYPFNKVDSPYGFVKRGVLYLENDKVKDIIECNIGYENNKTIAKPLDGEPEFEIKNTHPVSMNMFGFQKDIFPLLEQYFIKFLNENKDNLENCECLISEFLRDCLKQNSITLKYQTSNGVWLGMTYKEDLQLVKEEIKKRKENGEYKTHLWN